MANQCEMIIGFLVPHRCENAALGRCARCNREFCDEHVTVTPGGLECEACRQGLDRPVSLPATAAIYNPADIAAFGALSSHDDRDLVESESDTFADLS